MVIPACLWRIFGVFPILLWFDDDDRSIWMGECRWSKDSEILQPAVQVLLLRV
jgi:hypothetical protein